MEVVKTSGKACGERKGNHPVSLIIGGDDSLDTVFGYIGGDTVTVGQLHGSSLDALTLRYPYPDAERATGHSMKIELIGNTLSGELRDRHIEDTVNDCNVDLARIKLTKVDNEEIATTTYQRLSLQYEAQLARSTAISISKNGNYVEATPLFENALALADKLYPPKSARLIPYLTSLANSYMRTGKYAEFNILYNSRVDALHDDAVKQIFNHHQILSLLQVAKAAMGREDYRTALYNAKQALLIDYKNKDAIAANMSALVRSGKHDEAITFLEDIEQKLENEPDRNDVREAIALVLFQKAKKEQKDGKTVDAERSLRRAIKLDPTTTHYIVVLARLVHKTGKYSEADTILKRGMDSFKDEPRRQELIEARDKLRQTEKILTKIRKVDS
jgi:tetratricopeptide (TPR) repeat protein